VDGETDEMLRSALAERFAGRTVLTVAHRAAAAMDADRVLVMSDGVVVEEGPPGQLLADQESAFSKLLSGASQQEL